MALGELLPSRSLEPKGPPRDFLSEKIREWERNQIWPLAGDVVGAALVLNKLDVLEKQLNSFFGTRPTYLYKCGRTQRGFSVSASKPLLGPESIGKLLLAQSRVRS